MQGHIKKSNNDDKLAKKKCSNYIEGKSKNCATGKTDEAMPPIDLPNQQVQTTPSKDISEQAPTTTGDENKVKINNTAKGGEYDALQITKRKTKTSPPPPQSLVQKTNTIALQNEVSVTTPDNNNIAVNFQSVKQIKTVQSVVGEKEKCTNIKVQLYPLSAKLQRKITTVWKIK